MRRFLSSCGRRLLVVSLVSCRAQSLDPGPDLRVTPSSGSQSGGVRLRIEGEGLASGGALRVYIGRRAAYGIVVESPWQVRATTPPAEVAGPRDVTVHFEDGTQRVLVGGFTYEAPAGLDLRPAVTHRPGV